MNFLIQRQLASKMGRDALGHKCYTLNNLEVVQGDKEGLAEAKCEVPWPHERCPKWPNGP